MFSIQPISSLKFLGKSQPRRPLVLNKVFMNKKSVLDQNLGAGFQNDWLL